jgi:hypothetical protein
MSVSALARACLPLVLLCAPLDAQAPAYARDPADTLRYHELTETYTRSAAMTGEYTSLHDARIAITVAAGDSARAWYEALRLENRGGRNGTQKAGADAEGLPFVLAFGPRGVDSTPPARRWSSKPATPAPSSCSPVGANRGIEVRANLLRDSLRMLLSRRRIACPPVRGWGPRPRQETRDADHHDKHG